MGVKSAHKFFRKHKVPIESMDWDTFVSDNQKIYVDLMATSFQLIRSKMAHGKSSELIGILTSLFKHPGVVVVFDGDRSNEKELARLKRNEQMKKNITKHSKVNVFNQIIQKLKSKTKFRKWMATAYDKSLNCYCLTSSEKQIIIDGLKENWVFVEVAKFEADVHIAQIQNAVVVSSDSDYLFHQNISKVATMNTRSKKLVVWKTQAVRQTLNLCQAKLTFLGIVSGNDYSENPKGIFNFI